VNEIEVMLAQFQWSRGRTLGLLEDLEKEADPVAALSWRPGAGRAHVAWQLMHVGVTEELFATERLVPGAKPSWSELVPRFRGGSTPDDDIPSPKLLREVLDGSRSHLLATLGQFRLEQLDDVPPALAERGWSLRTVLNVLAWHEAHHQGQAHLTRNLWKARRPT
jgi:hypothetical protein